MKKYLLILFLPLFAFQCERERADVFELLKGPEWINDSTITTVSGQSITTYSSLNDQNWIRFTSDRYFYHSEVDSGSLNIFYEYENKVFYWKDGDFKPAYPSFGIIQISPQNLVTATYDSTIETLFEKYYHCNR